MMEKFGTHEYPSFDPVSLSVGLGEEKEKEKKNLIEDHIYNVHEESDDLSHR